MTSKQYTSQRELILDYYMSRPNQDIPHAEAVDWATTKWLELKGVALRDPDRAVRKLSQEGFLIKVAKGVYRYDPEYVQNRNLEDFTPQMKAQILIRDNYRCIVCGRGRQDGIELHIDHRKPKDLGGKATLDNGQTLCAQHNFQKKNYGQLEFGKRIFIDLYNRAKSEGDASTMSFASDVLEQFENHGVDSQATWLK